jgi:hypothetical protein
MDTRPSFKISTLRPDKIIFSPPEILFDDVSIDNTEIDIGKYNRSDIIFHVRCESRREEIQHVDLSVWGKKLYWVKTIMVDNIRDDTFSVTGFEAYPHLESLRFNWWDHMHDCTFNAGVTTNLNGIEFCTNLKKLSFRNHCVKDLTPIKNLPIEELNISNNPIISFDPINFQMLKHFVISASQISLFSDHHSLSSLEILEIEYVSPKILEKSIIGKLILQYGWRCGRIDHRKTIKITKIV